MDVTYASCLGVKYCLNVTCHGRRVTACCSIQARRTKDRGKFTVVPSRSWRSTIVGVALAHLAGQLETVRLGLEGPCLPFGGPERLAVRVG